MQQGGHECLRVQLPFRTLRGHRDRMGDVRFAAVAQLAEMGLVGEAVGAAHLLDVLGAQVVKAIRERGEAGGSCVQRRRAWPGRAFGGT
jgi:hypothetical protein